MRVAARPASASAGAASTASPRRVTRSMLRPARGLRHVLEASLAVGSSATHARHGGGHRPSCRALQSHAADAFGRARPACATAWWSSVPSAIPNLASHARWSAVSAPRARARVFLSARDASSRARHAGAGTRSSHPDTLVIVESPAKAVSVQKYLGDDHLVLASYGHVRDLVEKSGSVLPEKDFEMVWAEKARDGVVRDIVSAARNVSTVVLATDPDREGEAISWHILELLKQEGIVREDSEGAVPGGPTVRRVTFTEVTKAAVSAAFAAPRDVSNELVDAYLARRALDYLFGFSLSGVLWRKMPSREKLSAGRVQSVALRLICDREFEIERFRKREYWSVRAHLIAAATKNGDPFAAELTHVGGARLGKMKPETRSEAEACAALIVEANAEAPGLIVYDVAEKDVARKPKPPFTTSTMQQEASSKLGFGAGRTMSAAQSLYEGRGWGEGLITYMRTDGLHVSPEAVAEIRTVASFEFGPSFVPASPNVYKKKQKNAQEAHEAIRPTSAKTLPGAVANRLGENSDEARLYGLVWARAMASQMAPAVTKRVVVDVRSADDDGADARGVRLRANGSRLVFAGHLAAYGVGGDGFDSSATDTWLPQLEIGQPARLTSSEVSVVEKDPDAKRRFGGAAAEEEEDSTRGDESDDSAFGVRETSSNAPQSTAGVLASQHWSQPPGRYTEGTLVKALEEKGIGRPSTYASILRVITKRGYVTGSGGRGPLIPETRGRLVSSFLSHFFSEYVDYGFTAELENALDDVANGEKKWKDALSSFWGPFQGDVENLKGVRTSLVVDVLDATLGAHFFGDDETLFENRMRAIEETAKKSSSDDDPNAPYPEVRFDPETLPEKRKCPSCDDGRLGLKLSRAGGFIGCSNYPTCRHARTLAANHAANDGVHAGGMKFPAELGRDPATGRRVSVRDGPYGAYLELEVEPVSPEAEAAARAAREMRDAVELARLEQDAAREAEEMHARAAAAAAANGEKPPRKKKPAKVKLPKRKKNDESLVQKPRRFGLRNLDVPPEDVTLDLALDLLAYPLTLGVHPEDGAPVVMNAGPFGWYVSHAGANASLSRKILRESREEAARRGGGDAGSGDVDGASETVDAEDAKSWSNVGRTDRSSGGGDDAFSFVDDSVDAEDWTETASSVSANGDVSAAAFEAAALRASFAPVSLETALAVLTRKRSKPAREGTGRWGRGAKKDGDGDARPGAEAGTASPGKTKKKVKTAAKTKKTKGVSRVSAKSNAKRAPSSYMLYCAEARGSLPEGLKVTEQAKLLGAAWKALSDAERFTFEAAAMAAKDALASAASSGSVRKETKPPKTKRAPSSYMLYCAEARGSLPEGLKVTEQAKLLGAAWKALDDSERSRFEKAAVAAKEAAAAA